MRYAASLAMVAIMGLQARAAAEVTPDDYDARVYTDAAGNSMPYRLFIPRSYTPDQQYPLVVFLHGGPSRGTDNRRQIICCNGARVWAEPEVQAAHPAFILVPQMNSRRVEANFARGSHTLPAPNIWEMLTRAILESVRTEFSIDPRRIYLTGQSLGGYGTWDYALRTPDLFAAIIPIAGGGDPSRAANIASLAVWAFQGELDDTVPISVSRDMVAALLEAGGDPHYTEFPGAAHTNAVFEMAWLNARVREWLFSLRKIKQMPMTTILCLRAVVASALVWLISAVPVELSSIYKVSADGIITRVFGPAPSLVLGDPAGVTADAKATFIFLRPAPICPRPPAGGSIEAKVTS